MMQMTTKSKERKDTKVNDGENKPQSIFEKREQNLMEWASFWRANPHRFIEEYLGFNLFFFQKILIYLMALSPMFVFIASRGLGKSQLVAFYSVYRCILYPGTSVLISSHTKEQATLIIADKILKMYNDSAAVRAEIGSERNIKTSTESASVRFKNGSTINTSTSGVTARGRRANVLIVDEFAQVNKEMYDDVLYPIANVPRIPRFKEKRPKKYEDYNESNIQLLLTSAFYKSNWSWGQFKTVLNIMMEKGVTNGVAVALPYQLAIMHGILTQDTIDTKLANPSYDIYSFMMEYEAQFVGENENAYYSFDLLNKNRVIEKAFIPPTHLEYMTNKKLAKPKKLTTLPRKQGEIRFISLDVAMMGGKDNDTSVYTCIRMVPKGDNDFDRHVVYIESIGEAITAEDLAIRMKRLYNDFEADYAVVDTGGPGLNVYDALASILYDDYRDEEYGPWESINNEKHRTRLKHPNAKRVVYTVTASADFNDRIINQLKTDLSSGKIKLLTNDIEKRESLARSMGADWHRIDVEEQQYMLSPFQQTTALVNETIALSYKYNNGGKVSIHEPRNGTKDRFSSLAYGNYYANQIEMEIKNRGSRSDYKASNFGFKWNDRSNLRKRKGR